MNINLSCININIHFKDYGDLTCNQQLEKIAGDGRVSL